jgi:hypothetical protein
VPERLLHASRYRRELRRLALAELHFPLQIWVLHRPLPAELASPLQTLCDHLTRELDRAERPRRRSNAPT